jgi:hypothetical protein
VPAAQVPIQLAALLAVERDPAVDGVGADPHLGIVRYFNFSRPLMAPGGQSLRKRRSTYRSRGAWTCRR